MYILLMSWGTDAMAEHETPSVHFAASTRGEGEGEKEKEGGLTHIFPSRSVPAIVYTADVV